MFFVEECCLRIESSRLLQRSPRGFANLIDVPCKTRNNVVPSCRWRCISGMQSIPFELIPNSNSNVVRPARESRISRSLTFLFPIDFLQMQVSVKKTPSECGLPWRAFGVLFSCRERSPLSLLFSYCPTFPGGVGWRRLSARRRSAPTQAFGWASLQKKRIFSWRNPLRGRRCL